MGIGISTRVYKRLTASGIVKTGAGSVEGVICSTSSSGTLTLYDNTAGSGSLIVDVMPLVGGQWYPLPTKFNNGLYAVIGGTADVTFFI